MADQIAFFLNYVINNSRVEEPRAEGIRPRNEEVHADVEVESLNQSLIYWQNDDRSIDGLADIVRGILSLDWQMNDLPDDIQDALVDGVQEYIRPEELLLSRIALAGRISLHLNGELPTVDLLEYLLLLLLYIEKYAMGRR